MSSTCPGLRPVRDGRPWAFIGQQKRKGEKMETKCKDKAEAAFAGRMEDIRALYEADITGAEPPEDVGCGLADYGLGFELVEAGTYRDQRADYVCYQISWGGPSEEFRIYRNGDVEFWFLDWFDGAKVDVIGYDADIIRNIVESVYPDFIK